MTVCLVCGVTVNGAKPSRRGLLTCPQCGFVFAAIPADEPAALIALYQEDYFKGGEYDDYLRDRPQLQANFADRIATLQRFSSGGKLFEIGAAYGFFLELAQPYWQPSGIDVAEPAARYAAETLGLPVTCGEFLEYPLDPTGYDVFCMWDTIEHLARPDRYIERIARHLRPGGLLALTTGDIGSLTAHAQGERWRLIHPPTHLWYFSVHTMRQMLGRYGLEVVHLSHPGNYRSLSALARWGLGPLGASGNAIYTRLNRSNWATRGINLNLFDIMFVIAQQQ